MAWGWVFDLDQRNHVCLDEHHFCRVSQPPSSPHERGSWVALWEPWGSLGVALGWLWGGFRVALYSGVYA